MGKSNGSVEALSYFNHGLSYSVKLVIFIKNPYISANEQN